MAAVLALWAGVGSTGFESVLHAMDDPVALADRVGHPPAAHAGRLAGRCAAGAGRAPWRRGCFATRWPTRTCWAVHRARRWAWRWRLALFGVSPFATQWLARLGLTGACLCRRGGRGAADAGAGQGRAAHAAPAAGRRDRRGGAGRGQGPGHAGRPDFLQAMQAFMLGSTGYVGWSACNIMAGNLAARMAVAWALSPVLDGLALGEATAPAWGCRWRRMRTRWWPCWRWPPARPWHRPA
jgi:iron complex transport system permease protein